MKHLSFFFKTMLLASIVALGASCEKPGNEVDEGTGAPESIKLTAETQLLYIGESTTLSVEILPEEFADMEVTLSMDEESQKIAKLEGNVVTGLKVGSAFITATLGDLTSECEIVVSMDPNKTLPFAIEIMADKVVLPVGTTTNFSVEIFPEDADYTDYELLIDEEGQSVISVEGNTIKALAEGRATLTAYISEEVQHSVTFTVMKAEDIMASAIWIRPEMDALAVGESVGFIVTVYPEDAYDQNYTLSLDEAGKSILSLNNNIATALKEGVATVTVTLGHVSASCEVRVIEKGDNSSIEKILVHAAGASFLMGSPETEAGHFRDELQHKVTFTKDFYISKYEITNAQYAEFMNANSIPPTHSFVEGEGEEAVTYVYVKENEDLGIYFKYSEAKWVPAAGRENHPVVYVTWFGAKAYADWIGGLLPTEAQWEFACRAGSTTAFCYGDDPAEYINYGVCALNKEGEAPSAIGTKLPNAWGIYDMHGNVNEWCLDSRDMLSPYPERDAVDPVSPTPGPFRAMRGGSWSSSVEYSRSALRIIGQPDYTTDDSGFRVVFLAK